jgi:putative hydrolase of the HAD superfamily
LFPPFGASIQQTWLPERWLCLILCQRPTAEVNPALALAAFLAAAVVEGQDKLLFFSTKSLEASALRVGQLVGTSISKQGHGLIPITGATPRSLEAYRQGATAITLTMQGDDDAQVRAAEAQWRSEGVPFVSITLATAAQLGAGVFKREVATALTCALLDVNPFDEPDTQVGKEKSAEIVEGMAARGELPIRKARVRDKDIELYAEGETRQQISNLSLGEALRTFFELRRPHGYLAMISFIDGSSPLVHAALSRLREELADRLNIPVLLSAGPRYLHYFEQVYKGGPSEGLFLILTGEPSEDLAIPGPGYTFGQLQMALALGDVDALQSRQKLGIRLHLTAGAEPGLADLESYFSNLSVTPASSTAKVAVLSRSWDRLSQGNALRCGGYRQVSKITTLFFDIGGVILTNGWDRGSRRRAADAFHLDWEEFQDRHDLSFPAFDAGQISLEEYLDRTLFYRKRSFTRDDFIKFMYAESVELPGTRAVLDALTSSGKYFMATINNEPFELNEYRIQKFDLRRNFQAFFSSCYVHLRKPEERIFRVALRVTQRLPEQCVFIDDRPLNLESPRKLGMNVIHFQDAQQLRVDLQKYGIEV